MVEIAGGETDLKMVQWTIFPSNARARLRGPGRRCSKPLAPLAPNPTRGANLTAPEPTGPLGCDVRRARPVGGEVDQKMVQWTIFPPNARASLRGPGGRARSDLHWANLTEINHQQTLLML